MNGKLFKATKIFFIAALIFIVVGLTLFGVLGANQSIDYKSGYEVEISVDQPVEKAIEIMQNVTDNYFAENGINSIDYATQSFDGGQSVIYKFTTDVSNSFIGLKDALQTALDAEASITNVDADVVVRQVYSSPKYDSMGKIILAIGISFVLIFAVMFFLQKFAGAISTLFSGVLALVLYLSMLGITRIPAAPFAVISACISMVLAMGISIVMVNRYNKMLKSAEKISRREIIERAFTKSIKSYIALAIAVILMAVSLFAFGTPYLVYFGLQILVGGICAIGSAVFGTPLIWAQFKNKRK